MIQIAKNWTDFELIDSGEEEKLERWGKYILRRPDPQAIWKKNPNKKSLWENPDLFYHRSAKGGGSWENLTKTPESWTIKYRNLTFKIHPTAFKHTGVFPEQAVNWDRLQGIINKQISSLNYQPKILNLFAYTGGATLACMSAGAHVTHVDASKGMTSIAKENIDLSNLNSENVRFIVDDAVKFVQREINRGKKYDGIIMDPPVYGRGPTGQLWEIEKDLTKLVELCSQILSDKPIFFLINAYATTFSSEALENVLRTNLNIPGFVFETGELGLKDTTRGLVLPCGLFSIYRFPDNA